MEQLNPAEARPLAVLAIEALKNVDPEEFCRPNGAAYRHVMSPIAKLVWGIKTDPEALGALLSAHSHSRECWLPTEPARVQSMATMEILLRLKINISGERWVDGALIEPFKAGTLMLALERIEADLDGLFAGL